MKKEEYRNDKPGRYSSIYIPFILDENYNDIEIKKLYETRTMVKDI